MPGRYNKKLEETNWIIYVLTLAFAVYWFSNLFLWYPWSYDTELGMTLMLTVSPIVWSYVFYLAFRSYPRADITRAIIIVTPIFIVLATAMDFIFFGVIRQAMEELYHPTTLYGYGFLLVWPSIIALVFRKAITRSKSKASRKTIILTFGFGLLCLLLLTLIIVFDASS